MTAEKELTLDVPPPADDDAIEAMIDALPRDRVVEALHFAMVRRKLYAQIEKMAQSRIVADQILQVGETWASPDGTDYFWAGDRRREIVDPAALRNDLISMSNDMGPVAYRAMSAAFKDQPVKVYLLELDRVAKFGGKEVERTIKSYTKWTEGYPKLRPVEEGK